MINQDLVNYLRECGICQICQLRYLKARGTEYKNTEETFKRLKVTSVDASGDPPCKKQRLSVCPTCLGLFSEDFQQQLIADILSSEFSKFECPSIVVAISMPILLQIRQLSMWFALLRKFDKDVDSTRSPDVPLKEAVKLILNPILCEQLGKKYDTNGLMITINLSHSLETEEVQKLTKLHAAAFPSNSKRVEISRGLIEKQYIPTQLTAELFEQHLPIPPTLPDECLKLESIALNGPTVYVAGRYRKISRELSHTPWILNKQRIMEDSIEEIIISGVVPYFSQSNEKVIFMSSGREDVDVRCLGKGRPFVLEIPNSKRIQLSKTDAAQMENFIEESGKVSVRDLQVVSKDDLWHIKTGEEQKRKYYRALCALSTPVTLDIIKKLQIEESFDIQQKTPIRVLHRRPLHTRPRTIFSVKTRVQRDNPCVLVIDLVSQAGTYIKELIHGEFGRTVPSIASIIGQPIDILALDVVGIDLDWPPEVQNALCLE